MKQKIKTLWARLITAVIVALFKVSGAKWSDVGDALCMAAEGMDMAELEDVVRQIKRTDILHENREWRRELAANPSSEQIVF